VVEFSSNGKFLAQFSVDTALGSAFGLALRTQGDGFVLTTVDDNTAVLDTWFVQ
jgi:hypothetical protein